VRFNEDSEFYDCPYNKDFFLNFRDFTDCWTETLAVDVLGNSGTLGRVVEHVLYASALHPFHISGASTASEHWTTRYSLVYPTLIVFLHENSCALIRITCSFLTVRPLPFTPMSSPVKGGKDPNGPSTACSQRLVPDKVYDFNVNTRILVPYSAAKVPKLLGDLPLSMLGQFDFCCNVPYPSHPGLYTVDTKGDQPMLHRLHAADLMFLTHRAAQSSSAMTIAAPPHKFHEVQRGLHLETEDALLPWAKQIRDNFIGDLEANMFDSVHRSIHSSLAPS
jgi:hypothetical protein